jgi:hypothetical protein
VKETGSVLLVPARTVAATADGDHVIVNCSRIVLYPLSAGEREGVISTTLRASSVKPDNSKIFFTTRFLRNNIYILLLACSHMALFCRLPVCLCILPSRIAVMGFLEKWNENAKILQCTVIR